MQGDWRTSVAQAISWNDSKKERKGKLLALFMASAISLAVMSPAMRASMSETADRMVSVIVRALPGGENGAAQAVEQAGGEVGRGLGIIGGFEATVPQGSLAALERSPSVYEVTPNGKVQFLQTTSSTTSGTSIQELNALPGSLYKTARVIGADKYYKNGYEGQGVDVALIDTGVVPVTGLPAERVINGPDLSFESQFPETEYLDTMGHGTHMAGIIAADLDANALAAEKTAFEAQQATDKEAYLQTYDASKLACEALAEPTKGTCLAELDAAKATFESGQQAAKDDFLAQQAKLLGSSSDQDFQGMAPRSRIVSVKVGQADGAADVSQVIAAIDWVVQHKNDNGMNIRILSLSFGTDGTQDYVLDPLTFAVENAWHQGIVVVVAAGNSGYGTPKLNNPAYDPYVIAVGANDSRGTTSVDDDVVPEWSSRGNADRHPDFVAPGQSIVSFRSEGSMIDESYPVARVGDRFFKGTGTSQSAAVVSGAAALLLSQRPTLNPNQVKAVLMKTARTIPGADPVAQGAGVLSLSGAYNTSIPTAAQAMQSYPKATGAGSLELSRGTAIVADEDGVELHGEFDIFGMPFDGKSWSLLSATGKSWSGGTWNGSEWTGSCWCGKSWSGKSWSGKSWSGKSWSGKSWSGKSWSGKSWSGKSWSGKSWSGKSWSGKSWSGKSWSGKSWSGFSYD
jgi:serine protease AprX